MNPYIDRIKKLAGMRPAEKTTPQWRAGGIPWYQENGSYYVCLVTPTNPKFGGVKPCVPKGSPEGSDTYIQCAMREVSEETGIDTFKAVKPLLSKKISSDGNDYDMHVFSMETEGEQPLSPDFEGIPKWYEIIEATGLIRPSHLVFLDKLIETLGIEN